MSEPDIIWRYSPGPTRGLGCSLIVMGTVTAYFVWHIPSDFADRPAFAAGILFFVMMPWAMLWLGRPRSLILRRDAGAPYLAVGKNAERKLAPKRATAMKLGFGEYRLGCCRVRWKNFPWFGSVYFHDPGSAEAFARKVNREFGLIRKRND